MKPTLKKDKLVIRRSILEESSGPDLLGDFILQNDLKFYLDENEELFEGYGTLKTSYPYRQQNCYTRELAEAKEDCYVLENKYLKAVFLPAFGGRLWSLIDKTRDKNLLYTNDVIRFSNLAVRNAWFSGGVEWNIGIIGHSPFTNEQLYTAVLETEKEAPVLRMYEYERIRGVEYQMDFWLEEEDHFLNCRMRITNTDKEVKPMYWWSNMAVPEYENGQIVVPASEAYSPKADGVHKVNIHNDQGVDIVHYKEIPNQTDYFFDIPGDKPKYIANVDSSGYGLWHLSTNRLKSRKLFSWGKNKGSDNWQKFLTEQAGRYVEIQGGLGKTQYGCIPMPGHSAWEWIEQYGPVQLDPSGRNDELEHALTLKAEEKAEELEELLKITARMAKTPAIMQMEGSAYGTFKHLVRHDSYQDVMTGHLEFGGLSESLQSWMQFLETGILQEPSAGERPDEFPIEKICLEKLKETIGTVNQDNWYAFYQMGLYMLQLKHNRQAEAYLSKSLQKKENPWACHALAVVKLLNGENKQAGSLISQGLRLRRTDLGYVKDCFKILLNAKCYEIILEEYKKLDSEMQLEGRLSFIHIQALQGIGEYDKAYRLLQDNLDFELADVREGENSLADTWKSLQESLHLSGEEVPDRFWFECFS